MSRGGGGGVIPSTQATDAEVAAAVAAAATPTFLGKCLPQTAVGSAAGALAPSKGTVGGTVNRMQALPVFLGAGSWDRFSFRTFGTATSGGVCRVGLYADTGDFLPGALLKQSASPINVEATNTFHDTPAAAVVIATAGWYWLAIAHQVAANSSFAAIKDGANPLFALRVGTGADPNLGVNGIYQDSISGSLPDPWGATVNQADLLPIVVLRRSA